MTTHRSRASRSLVTALAAGALAMSCGDDAGGEGEPGGTSTTHGSQPTDGEATADAGETGVTGVTSEGGESTAGETGDTGEEGVLAPVVGVPNVDDDDENGRTDWEDARPGGDNDVGVFALPGWYVATVQAGERVELSLAGAVESVRFWRGDAVVLGSQAPGQVQVLAAEEAGSEFAVEFADFLERSTLTVRRLAADDAELDRREVAVVSAPLLVNHHLQPAEYVWAVPAGSNASMIATMAEVIGERFIEVDNPDIWIQDELEWATATAPGQRLDVAVDSIRDRQLDGYVKGLKAPDVQPMTWGQEGTDTTEDKFGNLEVTPPHAAGGTEFPFGRIYYGDADSCGPNPVIKEFLDRQRVQRPIHVDTCWLCVGHVDEFLSFVPDPDAPRGFRFLIADVPAAYALLAAMDPDTSLPRYANTHGYASVGEILEDDALRALNEDLQADQLDKTRELFKKELELSDEEVVRIPGLFERISNCSYKDDAVAALIPGMLNLTVVNFVDEAPHIFVSDPFMRGNGASQDVDPFIAAFRAELPPSFDIHFVDDWYTYHVAIGEVHCGTNVQRTPNADWWTRAMHLIEEP